LENVVTPKEKNTPKKKNERGEPQKQHRSGGKHKATNTTACRVKGEGCGSFF